MDFALEIWKCSSPSTSAKILDVRTRASGFAFVFNSVSGQLLSGKVEKLNVGDLVTFASKLVDASIPDVPADFLKFEDVNLYICPAGLSIGSTVYPQGFSFAADVVIFGKRANIACGMLLDVFCLTTFSILCYSC